MRKLLVCLAVLLCFVSLSAQTNDPFDIQLIVPTSTPDGKREVVLDRYSRIHVLLTNESGSPQRIWKDWNSWGYFNLQLDWMQGNRSYPIRRQAPESWDGDFPDFWLLEAGETLVLEVDMSTGEWSGFPDLYGEMIEADLVVTYQNKPDPLAKEFDVWVGKLVSKRLSIVFR